MFILIVIFLSVYNLFSEVYLIKPVNDSKEFLGPTRGLSDPFLNEQWYVKNLFIKGADIDLYNAYKVYEPKRDIIIAVIDSGIDTYHEDFNSHSLWFNKGEVGVDKKGNSKSTNGIDDDNNGYIDDVNGWNFVDSSSDILDSLGHGTHVGGIIAARSSNGIGIFSGHSSIKIMPLKVFSSSSPTAPFERISEALYYAINNGAHIVSNSYGSLSYSEDMREAIENAMRFGVLFVSAAGNSRLNIDVKPVYPASYGFPNQIVVGSTNNFDIFSNFSNYGEIVDILAPGDNILSFSPNDKYKYSSGTSQACPLVSLALGLIMSHNKDIGFMKAKELLLYGADERENFFKWMGKVGRLNVKNAILSRSGDRYVNYDDWKEIDMLVESPHPYPTFYEKDFVVTVPRAIKMKVHFNRLNISFDDDLNVMDGDGRVYEILNMQHNNTWSVSVPGSKIILRLISRGYVREYGFKVDKISYVEKP